MRRSLLLLAFVLPVLACADSVKRVGGTFTFYADAHLSLKEAKAAAIENARVQAIAAEFGTLVSQSTEQQETATNGREDTFFMQLSSTEVKGEWLEDIKEPQVEVVEEVAGTLVLRATVEGRARPVSNEASEFEAEVLRNGTEHRFADTRFRSGDDMFLRFRSPADGFLAVYLIDETRTAYCLLPYSADDDGQQPVGRNKDYVFFSPSHTDKDIPRSVVDEITMTCSDEGEEHNQVYVIFSPRPFTKATDTQFSETLPRQLAYADFARWLAKCRKRDTRMGLKVIKLKITDN